MKLFSPGKVSNKFAIGDLVYHKQYGFGSHQPFTHSTLVLRRRAHISKSKMRVLFSDDARIHWVEVKDVYHYEFSPMDYVRKLFGFKLKVEQ